MTDQQELRPARKHTKETKMKIGLKMAGKKPRLLHGHTINNGYSATYYSWQAMLGRCRYFKRDKERKYINRGISVCKRWSKFENFLADMGERPRGKSIERIDNNKGYSALNCRWATPTEQARNRRNKKLVYADALNIAKRMLSGECAKKIAAEYGISESLPREIHKGRTWRDAYAAARQ